ncbi:type II secretion system protein GspG [Tahibacter sp. UC22_41]|uniref:type II secretion system protein GspG n=1 Tax=Tahibacter sp. UC22_41 TaxID=3350178 RepID=UPI0036D8C042
MSSWTRRFVACVELCAGLLVLATLISWLNGMGGCDFTRVRYRAAQFQAKQLAQMVEGFRSACGRLPDQLDELFGVVRDRNCFMPPPRPSQLVDPWGSHFVYWRADDGGRFEVRSVGRDRIYGSFDDATSGGWTWPWPQPPWSWVERGRRFAPIVILVLAFLLLVALVRRLFVLAIHLVRAVRRRVRPIGSGASRVPE